MASSYSSGSWIERRTTIAVSTVDQTTALLVIDLQKGIVALPGVPSMPEVIERSCALTAAFRRSGLPVVLVNVDAGAPGRTEQSTHRAAFPAGWTELIPELDRQPSDHTVTKRTWGAFTHTDLEQYLRTRGVTQVVIVGVATSAGVESTARHAHELGFNVTLAVDAMADTRHDAHINSLTRVFPRLGETGTTQEIIDLIAARSI